MRLRIAAKSVFFLQRLQTRYKKSSNKGLVRVGQLIRGAARRLIRLRSGPSMPNTPPHAHTRGGLRVIEYHATDTDVVIGPMKFSGSNFFNKPVPYIHEFGGLFASSKGFRLYPERSYMYRATKQLQAKGLIAREYSIELRKAF